MSVVKILEVKTRQELKQFVRFPMDLYKGNPYFVPSLIKDELDTWNPKENPALLYSKFKLFLAFKDNKIVGRIAVIINEKEKKELNISKVRFGWLDFIDDLEVSRALIQQAEIFAKENQINTIEGPMGFTNLDKAGMLIKGFDKLATIIGIYNYDYYPKHLESLGLTKEKEWIEFELIFPDKMPDKIIKFNDLITEKYQLRALKFKNKKEILQYVEPMFKLLDETYKVLSTYTPITKEQIETYKEKYFSLIDKDFICCIVDNEDNLIAFAITMPSYSTALQKAKGKLLPFGWWHLMNAAKKTDRANFYLIGVHPDFQKRGITSIIFSEISKTFKERGIKYIETNPELEDNKNIQALWQDYQHTNHKRRRTYAKKI